MTTFLALLRGINVGKAKRVAMADLRAMVEGLGYRDVRTLLNSGNVVFDAPAPVRGAPGPRIEAGLTDVLGVSARVTVVSATDLVTVVDENPLAKAGRDPSRLLVGFLASAAERKKLEPLANQPWGKEGFALGKGVVYTWCPDGVLESAANKAIARVLKDGITSRNWATVIKLVDLASQAD